MGKDRRAMEITPVLWLYRSAKSRWQQFALDIVARAARAVAVGVSALNHEAVDYAVKGQTVVELLSFAR